jgi:hypothetical protein
MLLDIVPDFGAESTPGLDVAPLAFALERMTPSLFAPALPGEALADVRSRKAAAADILDDLLAEYEEELEEDRPSGSQHLQVMGMPGSGKSVAGAWSVLDELLTGSASELEGDSR